MKFPVDTPYHLFASCLPVKGVVRSIIYDLQRDNFEYIPNSLFDILTEFNNISFNDLLEKTNNDAEKVILINYFEFMFENEFIFFSKLNSEYFPKYDISFSKPYNLSCLIIDFQTFDFQRLEILKREIINTKIECLIFRFLESNESEIQKTLTFFNDIPVRTIQLFINDKEQIENSFLEDMMELNKRVSTVLKYNSTESSVIDLKNGVLHISQRDIIHSKMRINDINDFDINTDLYMESKLHNNFFNKRAYINLNGDIHRYETDSLKFGNINYTSLMSIYEDNKFTEFWQIKKDEIEICKDCEYRYMCVDSREPINKNELGLWVLEGNCKYNPFEAEWNV